MKVLVLGGTRFIGRHTVTRLAADGHTVAVFYRGRTPVELPAGVSEILGDRNRLDEARAAFAAFGPDVVLDMLAFTEAQARALVETFRGLAGRLVMVSSQDVYRAFGRVGRFEAGPPEPLPLTEESPLRKHLFIMRQTSPDEAAQVAPEKRRELDDYEKILVERVVMGQPDLPSAIARLPAVYGPGDAQHRFFALIKRMDDGRPVILLDARLAGWRWARSYVENVAAAVALVVTDERAAGRVYNVADAATSSEAEWVGHLARLTGWTGRVVALPAERLPAHLRAEIDTSQDLVFDTARIRRELGFTEPVALDEGLRRTIAWERAHPPEQIDPADYDYAAEDAAVKSEV